MQDNLSRWCILRTAGPRTLKLAKSLSDDDIIAWTPTATERKRKPRSRTYTDREVPILASFVFAASRDIRRLLVIEHSLSSAHPPFRVFRQDGDVPTVADAELGQLREVEARLQHEWEMFLQREAEEAKRKHKKTRARAYVLGQRVRVHQPAFGGLTGEIVEIRKNGDLAIEFTGFVRGATIASCDVEPVHIDRDLSERTRAA